MFRRIIQSSYLLIILTVFIFTLCILGNSTSQTLTPQKNYEQVKANFEKIVTAAKKEGKVTIYGGFEPIALDALDKSWKMRYPEIKMEVLDARSAELMARVEAEQASKTYVCDFWNGSTTSNWVFKDAGIVVNFNPQGVLPTLNDPTVKWFNKPIVDPDGTYIYGAYGGAWGIVINTKMVPPDKEPKSWADLTDPYWKSKMLVDHPGGMRAGGTWYLLMKVHMGDDYLNKMVNQKPNITTIASANATKQVVVGEYPLQFPAGAQVVAEMPQDTPIKFIFPKEGWMPLPAGFSVVKNAPHPNATIVLMEFLLSKEGQMALAKSGRYIARADVPLPFPKYQNLSNVKMLELFSPDWLNANKDRLFAEARKRFGLE